MARSKSSISKARTYEEMGEFWDTHDLADYWEQTKPVEFTVDIKSESVYYSLESSLDRKIQDIARNHGVSSETLLNLWVQEHLQKEVA
jgi:hypothetical protein